MHSKAAIVLIKNTVQRLILIKCKRTVCILIYFKIQFILVMAKLNFQHQYSSLQCLMILQKSF